MKKRIELTTFLSELREEFAKLTNPEIEPIPHWNDVWQPLITFATIEAGQATISVANLRHALALTLLYVGHPISKVQAIISRCEGTAPEIARLILDAVTERVGFVPAAHLWLQSPVVRDLVTQIHDRFLRECLDGLAREAANQPEEDGTTREFVYSSMRLITDDDGLSYVFTADETEEAHQVNVVALKPGMVADIIWAFRGLERDRLGWAMIALMQYGVGRAVTGENISETLALIAMIESQVE